MNEFVVQCPCCWETQTIELEEDVRGTFVQDCEVCCRPWQVTVSIDEDGQPSVCVASAD